MKTIHNSDIRFELNPRIIYVSDFEMTFYTVNKRDFSFRKTNADVQEVEVSGETKYYLDLDWSLLSYVGKGVLNYQCINNITDPSFPDGEYNQLVEKTTDYYIDTFKVEPESTDKSITELLGEEVEARIAGDLALSGAVNTEVNARIAGDEAISGAVDTALSGKQDTLIAGENIYISGNVISAIGGDLSNYYTKSEVDTALSGKADSDDVYTKGETSGKTEISTALDGKLDVTAYTPTDLSNYYTKSETSGKTEISTALATKLDTTAYTPTDLSNYYTKGETSGKTEIATALSAKADSTAVIQAIDQAVSGKADSSDVYLKSETSGKTEISTALASKLDTTAYTPTDLSNYYTKGETSGKTEISTAFTSISGAVDTALLGYVNNANYNTSTKAINLLHGNTVIASIDATDFIKDGMVDNVVISGGSLVITFNTDAGKEAITIALTDIFDPSNYYTKSDVDSALSGKADTTAVTEAINQTVSGKADSDDVYLKSETSGATEISTALSTKLDTTAYTPTDLSNYYTKGETSGATELSTAFNAKLDTTAYTPTDLSNYYTKSETSGKTEIQTALSGKQETLVSGTNIKTINNESILGSGNIDIQGGGSSINVVQTTGTSSGDVMSQNAVTTALSTKLDTTAYTPTDLSNYYTKSETSGKTEISTALASKQGTLSAGTGVDITNDVISVTGGTGGKAVSGGTNISITTGETADTINCTLPISGSIEGIYTTSSYPFSSTATKRNNAVFGDNNLIDVFGSSASSKFNAIFGQNNQIKTKGNANFIAGSNNVVNAYGGRNIEISDSALFGKGNKALNIREFAIGSFNVSNNTNEAFSSNFSGNTLFSVGNGTADNARHNAFEIRQNGDIYITSGGTDIKLQDNLGGGSSINVVQTTGTSTSDVMSQNAVSTELSGKQETLTSGTNIKTINGNSILGSGNITIQGGSGNDVVELTQAEYDALVSKDPNVFYIITDATPADLTNYYTKSETSGKTEISTALSTKLDTTAYTPTDLSNYYTKSETSGATEISTALASKQGTLSAGTGIDITNDVISVTGGTGGGKAIEAGRGISITTGETADTVSFDLPISAGTGSNSIIFGDSKNQSNGVCAFAGGSTTSILKNEATKEASFAFGKSCRANGLCSHAEGYLAKATGDYSHAECDNTTASGNYSHAEGNTTTAGGSTSHAEGHGTKASGNYSHAEGLNTTANTESSHAEGRYTKTSNRSEHASGEYNNSVSASTTFGDSGNTLFSVGNGTDENARHNAFEIRQNGDIYITSGGTDIKLQDNLGGGSSINVVQTTGTSTSDVMSQDAVTTALATKADAANLGGLKLQQITQSAYDALTTKDASTLYVIVN